MSFYCYILILSLIQVLVILLCDYFFSVLYLLYLYFNLFQLDAKAFCKNHLYGVFEHSCVAAVCENKQPIVVKIHSFFKIPM